MRRIQAGYRVQPLSAFLKQPAPPATPAIAFPRIDKSLVAANFFAYLDFVLQFAPPAPEETAVRARLARIGIGPGKAFALESLPAEAQLGLKPQRTYEEFLAAAPSLFKTLPQGWKARVVKLEKDLDEKPEGGVAAIMSDEFFNVYDKTGPGMSNYKP
jgi:hypothetical protein